MGGWWAATAVSAALALTVPAFGRSAPTPVKVENLVADFDRFAQETAALPDSDRATRFRARFASRAGGLYDVGDRDPARYDASIVKALDEWPARRAAVLAVARAFDPAAMRGLSKFRRAFPDFNLSAPTYLVHSLGEMDGGTRDFGNGTLLFFGADLIARIHDAKTIGPLFDHELFHVYHAASFPDCEAIWCSLWVEGLAVYASARLNPGADDAALLLDFPQPIRPAVEPRLREAMCTLAGKLDSKRQKDIAPLFQGQAVAGSTYPPRYGYYLGFVLARQLGRGRPLAVLARMRPAEVRPLLERAIKRYGRCATPAGNL